MVNYGDALLLSMVGFARLENSINPRLSWLIETKNQHGCWGLVVLAGSEVNCRHNIFSSSMFAGSPNDCLARDVCTITTVEDIDWPRICI